MNVVTVKIAEDGKYELITEGFPNVECLTDKAIEELRDALGVANRQAVIPSLGCNNIGIQELKYGSGHIS